MSTKKKDLPLNPDDYSPYEYYVMESAFTCVCCGGFLESEVPQESVDGYRFVSCSHCGQVNDYVK